MNRISIALAVMGAAMAPAAATATIVNVDGAVTGCASCNGSPHPAPGDTLGQLYSPVLVTLGPGTYSVTNAVGQAGALYDAWRFNGSEENWIWSIIIANAATRQVVLDSLSPVGDAFVGTHAAVANSSYALNYNGTFTLAATTQLAFLTEDYAPGDNAGGVSLNVQLANVTPGVPEPATWAMMIAGFGVVGGAMRRRGRPAGRTQAA